jgi:metal-responsive CopG/Arc/MetJ family transcriptional regulator
LYKELYGSHAGTTGMVNQIEFDKLGITLPKPLVKDMDKDRGEIPRSRYIKIVLQKYLKRNGGRR